MRGPSSPAGKRCIDLNLQNKGTPQLLVSVAVVCVFMSVARADRSGKQNKINQLFKIKKIL